MKTSTPLPGSLSLAASIRQTNTALDETLRRAKASAGNEMTGFALVVWNQQGSALVHVHHSMHSGIEPVEAPTLVGELVQQHGMAALAEAKRHPRV